MTALRKKGKAITPILIGLMMVFISTCGSNSGSSSDDGSNQVPSATNLDVSGDLEVGSSLTGSYLYEDTEDDAEGSSQIQWTTFDTVDCSGSGNAVGTAATYILLSADAEKYIQLGITPEAATGTTPGSTALSDCLGPVADNAPPHAYSVAIYGSHYVGKTLTGEYDYSDDEDDPEGLSRFRWLVFDEILCTGEGELAGNEISYTVQSSDEDKYLQFEVTPIATRGDPTGDSTASMCDGPIYPNTAPSASDVSFSGELTVGKEVRGAYTYSDAESDPEGTPTYRWLTYDDASCQNNETTVTTTESYTWESQDSGKYVIFEVTPVATTGATTGDAVQSSCQGPVQLDNTAPVASNVHIDGTIAVDQELTGDYIYSDAEGDLEGASTFRWLRYPDSTCMSGGETVIGTNQSYTLTTDDNGKGIRFEVTPVAQTGVTIGTAIITNGCTSISW